jgi:hypothetical protein
MTSQKQNADATRFAWPWRSSARVAEFQTISQGGLESKFAANANQTLTHVKNQLNTPLGGERSCRSLYIRELYIVWTAIAFPESHGSGEQHDARLE